MITLLMEFSIGLLPKKAQAVVDVATVIVVLLIIVLLVVVFAF